MAAQPIEGITPIMVWITLSVLIAGGTIYLLFTKVREAYRKEQERKQIKQQPSESLANEIVQKVLDKMEIKFQEIDRKLANDKALIDSHTREISVLMSIAEKLQQGDKAQCLGMLALLNHALHNGNKDEIEEASKAFNTYLTEK